MYIAFASKARQADFAHRAALARQLYEEARAAYEASGSEIDYLDMQAAHTQAQSLMATSVDMADYLHRGLA